MNKIILWFKNLDKNKQILLALSLVIIILGGLSGIMESWRSSSTSWDYKTKSISKELISKADIVYDRDIYWTINNIKEQYIDSYIYDVSKASAKLAKVSYKDYYKVLDEKYKKNISKGSYEKQALTIFEKIAYIDDGYETEYTILKNRIGKIYKYGDNMYLCSLIVDKQNGIEMVKGEGYIGIKLNKNNKNNSFEIFYIGGQYE